MGEEVDPGNPFQKEEDRADDETALLRIIHALRGDSDRNSIIAAFLRKHEGEDTDVSARRIKNFVRESKRSVRQGRL